MPTAIGPFLLQDADDGPGILTQADDGKLFMWSEPDKHVIMVAPPTVAGQIHVARSGGWSVQQATDGPGALTVADDAKALTWNDATGRFVMATVNAADADTLDGLDSTAFLLTNGSRNGASKVIALTAASIPLTLQNAVSQTANIQNWDDSDGTTVLASISPLGYVSVGKFAGVPDTRYAVSTDVTNTTNTLKRGAFYQVRIDTTLQSNTNAHAGNYGKVIWETNSGSNIISGTITGLTGEVQNNVVGTATEMWAVYANPRNTSTGTVTNLRGVRILMQNTGGGTVTNAYGLYVDAIPTAATAAYAIFTNAGIVNLGGSASLAAWGTAGAGLRTIAATYTDSSTASGTVTNAVFNSFGRPTLAATNASITTTNVATLYVANSPLAGTNQTLTNKYALWVDDGDVRLDGNLLIGQTGTPTAFVSIGAGTTGQAQIRHIVGVAPTTPNDGDTWYDGAFTSYATDATTAAIVDTFRMRRASSGTPAAGFGIGFSARLMSSTTANRDAGRLTWAWTTATDASRAAQGQLSAFYTTTERPVITWGANSTVPLLSFYDVTTPIAKPTRGATLTNNVTAGGTTDQIDDFVGTLYATDAATIRNDIYQLARALRQIDVGLRALGLFT